MTENKRKPPRARHTHAGIVNADTHMHARTHTLTRALSFPCLYYWCWARFVPTQPSVLDSPTLCPFCSMPTTTLAGWHKQSDVVLSKCERLINIPRYLQIGDRRNIPKRDTCGGGWFVLFLGWLPKHGLICGVRSNHVTTTWAVNRIGIRAFSDGLSITFWGTFSRGSSNRSPLVFGSNRTQAKLPGESREWSRKTWLGPSWDRGHVTCVFETLGNTFLIHGWGFQPSHMH